jgi:hypothetical protein
MATGKLHAQTADVQRAVDTRLAVARLQNGIRIAESIQVLTEAALIKPVRTIKRAGATLRRFFDRLNLKPGGVSMFFRGLPTNSHSFRHVC